MVSYKIFSCPKNSVCFTYSSLLSCSPPIPATTDLFNFHNFLKDTVKNHINLNDRKK